MYGSGQYVREKLATDEGCVSYRVKEIKPGVKLLVCLTRKKGRKGGRTKAVSLLRSVNVDLRKYRSKEKRKVAQVIKKARKLKAKQRKKK